MKGLVNLRVLSNNEPIAYGRNQLLTTQVKEKGNIRYVNVFWD